MNAVEPHYSRDGVLHVLQETEYQYMYHRNLTHQEFTLAAIDDMIARGKRQDWAELRKVALADHRVLEKILRVCQVYVADPYAQRYRFWKHYVERYLA